MKKYNQNLKSSLIISSSGMLIVTILALNIILAFIFYQYIEHDILQKNNALVNSVKHEVSSFFKKPQQSILRIDDLIANRNVSIDEIQKILDNSLKYSDVFSNFFLLDTTGNVLVTSPSDSDAIGTDHSLYPYFKNVSDSAPLYWSKAFFTYNSKKPLVSISLKSKNKILVGIINLDALGSLVQELDLGKNNYITIIDSTGTYIAHSDMKNVYQRGKDPFYKELIDSKHEEFKKIVYGGQTMIPSIAKEEDQNWSVVIYQSYSELISPIFQFITTSFILTILLLIFSSVISYRRVFLLTSSIDMFIAQSNEVSKGNYNFTLEDFPYAELNVLKNSFLTMASNLQKRELALKRNEQKIKDINESLEIEIEKRTLDLEISNKNLSNSLTQLKSVQERLIQNEKLAALGELITGIAHELNTPIGVSITTVSYLEMKRKELENAIEKNHLKKSQLSKFLSINQASLQTLELNLRKSSDLIELFKQLSTTPDNSDFKKFNISVELQTIYSNLKNQLSQSNIIFNIDCFDHIEILSYKHSFNQVVLQLIHNAMAHAFESPFSKSEKKIDIVAKIENDKLLLTISDNGIGLAPNVLNQVLNPFFTTARGRGFSGLGLNICYNIVSTNLSGEMTISSEKTLGTTITLHIPVNLISS